MILDEHIIWVAITQCPSIGQKRFEQLLEYLKSIQLTALQFWQLTDNEIKQLQLKTSFIETFLEHRKTFDIDLIQDDLHKKNIQIYIRTDPSYPSLLKETPDSPAVLFVQGNLNEQWNLPIAIVGTRKVTSYGRMVTKLLTTQLVKQRTEIISGFMYGVDSIAHQTAIECGGYTVAVLGYGFDFCYPLSQTSLKEQIIENGGALISEYLPSTPPIPGQFPQRNRIVAGLSKGVLVTEAAEKSGSKITASLAVEYGRDVFAVPGAISSPYSEGTKDLVNCGAKLVSNGKDILEEYETQLSCVSSQFNLNQIIQQAENDKEKVILELLAQHSLTTDEIVTELNVDPRELLSCVSMLEMKGLLQFEKGKYFLKW